MPLESATVGCLDDWNSLDHFDPTMDMRHLTKQFMYLRTVYNALQDGFNLVQCGNWTFQIQRPGSNGTATKMGLWSVSHSGHHPRHPDPHKEPYWPSLALMNTTNTWSYNCKGNLWISSPYQAGTVVHNLLSPTRITHLQSLLLCKQDSTILWVYAASRWIHMAWKCSCPIQSGWPLHLPWCIFLLDMLHRSRWPLVMPMSQINQSTLIMNSVNYTKVYINPGSCTITYLWSWSTTLTKCARWNFGDYCEQIHWVTEYGSGWNSQHQGKFYLSQAMLGSHLHFLQSHQEKSFMP